MRAGRRLLGPGRAGGQTLTEQQTIERMRRAVSLRIFAAAAADAVTVPDSAVVDDAGQPVIFVQVAGESFKRRPVRLGNREAGLAAHGKSPRCIRRASHPG